MSDAKRFEDWIIFDAHEYQYPNEDSMSDDAFAFLLALNDLRAKWESVPWEDLWIALECSMVEEYLCHPHDGKHVAIAKTWFAANAPKEAAE